MKVKTLSLLAGASSLLLAGTASADFLGISLELQSEQAVTGAGPAAGFGPSTTYHIYANFSVETLVTSVYGLPAVGDTAFFTLHSGSIFNQQTAHGQTQITPPSQFQLDSPNGPHWALDSYYTLGGLVAEFAPGTASIIGPGGAWTGSWSGEFAWFLAPPPADPAAPTGTKILLAQLTVSGLASDGSVGLFEGAWGVQANGENLFDWDGGTGGAGSGDSYFTNIPAPGVLALLGIAGLVGARRRRA